MSILLNKNASSFLKKSSRAGVPGGAFLLLFFYFRCEVREFAEWMEEFVVSIDELSKSVSEGLSDVSLFFVRKCSFHMIPFLYLLNLTIKSLEELALLGSETKNSDIPLFTTCSHVVSQQLDRREYWKCSWF